LVSKILGEPPDLCENRLELHSGNGVLRIGHLEVVERCTLVQGRQFIAKTLYSMKVHVAAVAQHGQVLRVEVFEAVVRVGVVVNPQALPRRADLASAHGGEQAIADALPVNRPQELFIGQRTEPLSLLLAGLTGFDRR
jgi:hypothetical protein